MASERISQRARSCLRKTVVSHLKAVKCEMKQIKVKRRQVGNFSDQPDQEKHSGSEEVEFKREFPQPWFTDKM